MNAENYLNRLGKEALAYLGWGAACGSVSLGWAWIAGFNKGPDLGAMIAGVATWSVLCAIFSISERVPAGFTEGVWGRALRLALRSRAALTLAGAAMMGLSSGVSSLAGWWEVTGFSDLITGAISPSLTRGVVPGTGDLPGGFFAVYLATLVQGAWVIASILGVGGVIRCFLRNEEKAVASREVATDAAPL